MNYRFAFYFDLFGIAVKNSDLYQLPIAPMATKILDEKKEIEYEQFEVE